ncbi:hypothetical protein P153DRAFT_419867 [Dothidotthia symphoricarpi CBS 119687]|uniref:Uncharacterized protein n=1 Tax=Dothidotthia symphoricarpi CBS 119687 TaxID=1392245 RepID=A0A6A6ASG1_9PLEO|nr:uncharacterized protein P153DRAFT_419867 [Dothidotthia symphoricarpi CBS 119687]KAF2134098.1 hypothetical protein P153DRAFT_419867 [Dothidotthia symphoricarpi CBS 119687]
MAPSRAYVPSRALLRALSRPQPLRCPFARPLPIQLLRGKRTKAAKLDNSNVKEAGKAKHDIILDPKIPGIKPLRFFDSDADVDKAMRPLPDSELEADDMPVINWYEQDLDKGGPRRLIQRIATPEDRKKDKEMFLMIEESATNPDYDDAELNKRLMDSLMSNPNFADLTQELKEIKQGIKTKEEIKVLDEQAEKDAQPEIKQFSAGLRMATHQAIQDLIDDPDVGDAKAELREVLDKMPEMEDIENPEFQAALDKAMSKLSGNEALQKKMAAKADDVTDTDFDKEWTQFETDVDDTIKEGESDDSDLGSNSLEDLEDVDKLLYQMRDVLKSLGGDSQLEAELERELDAELSDDPESNDEAIFEREMDPEELAEELTKLAASSKPPSTPESTAEDNIPADLQAKVDKIMDDPRLMEKLTYIQKLISESKQSPNDLTTIAHEVAPDPLILDPARTTTLKQRIAAVREDPEHTAALDNLRVTLLPPFNISPALKSFNQAIELAYIGANDDIRRILWRAYQKARELPTFLQNVSDDAWDILYYSQAVTWGSNQNRESHLRVLLGDLRSLGREGPPTHPGSLVNRGEGEGVEE